MRRQRNKSQVTEQGKSPKELNEVEASNLEDAEFKVMPIRMLKSMKKDI